MKLYQLSGFFILLALLSCGVQRSMQHEQSSDTVKESRFLEAESARLLGNEEKARNLYEAFVRSYPDNGTAWYNLGQLYLQRLELKRAERALEKACSYNPENKFFRELYAVVLIMSKKNAEASRQYDQLIAANPQDVDYRYEKAIMYERTGEYDQAIRIIDQLEAKTGFSEELIDLKRKIFLKQGKPELAVKEVEKLKQADQNSPLYDRMIADIYEDAKLQEKADQVYHQMESRYPDHPMAQMMLAQYYAQRKDTANYNRLMQLITTNNNLDLQTKIAMVVPALRKMDQDTNHRAELVDIVRRVRNESQGNKDAISLYASVLYATEQYDEALTQFRQALRIDRHDIDVWIQILSICAERADWQELVRNGLEGLQVFPENPSLFYFTGMGYLRTNKADSSISCFTKALHCEKNNMLKGQYHALLGEAWNALGNYRQSDTAYTEALRLQPGDAMTLNNYAYYLSVRGERLEEAEKMSKKSLQLIPGTTSFLDTYGWILYRQGRYAEAQKYILQAIESGGQDDGTIFEHLGDVYEKLGDKIKAKECWKKANEKGEDNPALRKKIEHEE